MAKIAKRAFDEKLIDDMQTTMMDLCACHANGTPLDFQKLLDFPRFDFTHDVFGLVRHMNRETGKLRDHFLPRCAVQ